MDRSKRGKGDYDDSGYSDKTRVLQEAKQCFMDTSVKPRKRIDVLTECISLILRGERLTSTEATDLFFLITRLFQYKDSALRRLIYIAIKELSDQAENTYIVTSSLIADVNSSSLDPSIRAAALRALCHISDASTFTTIERYLKQCIVDKHPVVASAALTSLLADKISVDVVRRFTTETQEALHAESSIVQMHALAVRYKACRNDRRATTRLIDQCIKIELLSPIAICHLLRIITRYINESPNSDETKQYISYIQDCMNHRSDSVELEAANAIVELKKIDSKAYKQAVTASVEHLRKFLLYICTISRYGAVEALNKLSMVAPTEVRECNLALEGLLAKPDRHSDIANLAITTLLNIGTESSVDRFLKQIGEFLSEVDDNFKTNVVISVRKLCEKYPAKHVVMMDFLSNMLREEGNYRYKKEVVDTIIEMIEKNEGIREKGLENLCEFIEDCEHDDLALDILHFLGCEGPKTKRPSTYVRYIVNRPLLDGPLVAGAAITALAKFGTIPELADNIIVLLERFSRHKDFHVMERAVLYKNILKERNPDLNNTIVFVPKLQISFPDLQKKLLPYLEGDDEKPVNIAELISSSIKKEAPSQPDASEFEMDSETEADAFKAENIEVSAVPLHSLFDGVEIGDLIKSTKPIALTDSVSEFDVKCTYHIYLKHIIFQFDCTNTVASLCLENIGIELDPPPGFEIVATTVHPKLAYNETVPIYVCVELVDEACCTINYFTNLNLKYHYREVNPETGEVDEDINEDIFPLEDMLINLPEVLSSDHIESLGWSVN